MFLLQKPVHAGLPSRLGCGQWAAGGHHLNVCFSDVGAFQKLRMGGQEEYDTHRF